MRLESSRLLDIRTWRSPRVYRARSPDTWRDCVVRVPMSNRNSWPMPRTLYFPSVGREYLYFNQRFYKVTRNLIVINCIKSSRNNQFLNNARWLVAENKYYEIYFKPDVSSVSKAIFRVFFYRRTMLRIDYYSYILHWQYTSFEIKIDEYENWNFLFDLTVSIDQYVLSIQLTNNVTVFGKRKKPH